MIISRYLTSLLVSLVLASTPTPAWSGLPVRTATHSGIAGDPVNVAIEGSRSAIVTDFARIGWVVADPLSVTHDSHLAEAAAFHRLYPKAPVSSLYLFGRAEDFAVERELGSVARRDHARLWDTGRRDPATGLELWIGDASRDIGVKILFRHHIPIGTTHRIDANVDAERDLIVSSLRSAAVVDTVVMEPGIGHVTDAHNAGGDRFYTDGKVALIVLKPVVGRQ